MECLTWVLGLGMPFLGMVNFLCGMMIFNVSFTYFRSDTAIFLPTALIGVFWLLAGMFWGQIILMNMSLTKENYIWRYLFLTLLFWIGIFITLGLIMHSFDQGINIFDPNQYKLDPEEGSTIGIFTISTWLLPLGIFWLGFSAHYFRKLVAIFQKEFLRDVPQSD